MKTKNECYTYFRISGDFDPDTISEMLGILPDRSWKIGDSRNDGSTYDFSSWSCGRCDEYDLDTGNQMRKTISVLSDKIDVLNSIRKEFDVIFVLEVVPTIYVNDIKPALAPPLDVIDFCHATRTELDIDYYII